MLRIIKNLHQNKTHQNDGTSIRMIKLCDRELLKPLSVSFNTLIILFQI